jgi:hypothetical protein
VTVPVQLAIWEIIFLCVIGWAICWIFYKGDCWTFDSLGWPISPVYTSLFFWFHILRNNTAQFDRHILSLFVSVVYAVQNGFFLLLLFLLFIFFFQRFV